MINEVSLLIYPSIDGLSGVRTIFEYSGNTDLVPGIGQNPKLISMRKLDYDFVWLRYKILLST